MFLWSAGSPALGNRDLSCSTGARTCCGEFAGARVAAVHAAGRCPQSKPAACPGAWLDLPGCSLGARGFSVKPDHFPDLGHSSTDDHADAMEGCLGAEGVTPACPWVGCGSIQPPLPDAGSCQLLSILHGTPRLCWTPGRSNHCPAKPSRTQGRGRETPLPRFPAGFWVGN